MGDTDKVNILIVDDLPEKLLVYRTILEELEQNIVTSASGAEALKQVLRHDFAVILLDVNMPGMDGFETASLIRKRKQSAHTPIIFITAYVDEVRAVEGYAHGAVDYILVPVEPEILRAKVRVFVDLCRMRRQVERQAQARVALAEEQAKRAAAEEANRRSAFLAEASRVLANSLDLEATLGELARVAVPVLADLAVVGLADEQGRLGLCEWAWIEPDRGAIVEPLTDHHQLPERLTGGIQHVLATGQSQLLPRLDQPPPAHDLTDPPPADRHRIATSILNEASALVLPLAARGRILGALALVMGPAGRRQDPGDLPLADDLACRAGIAIDNALLVRDIKEGDRRKDEFLAMLSHELRNPLAPIRNAVEIMRMAGPLHTEMHWARDMIDRQLRLLNRLVDDLLDVSRITRGKIQLRFEPVDVAAVVTSAVETSRPLIESRNHNLTVAAPAEPIYVSGDFDRLAQVLSNLLNNAAKYTESNGHIWLTVERESGNAVFRVRDTGAGIPPNMLPYVFDLFTQLDPSLDRSHGGLGIGLTLVRHLVEMHQGSVQALSQGTGQGSEFVVRLPALSNGERRPAADAPSASSVAMGAKRRILVVDDNVDVADTVAKFLRLHAHEVCIAHDGLAALEAAQSFSPEIVLLDIGLPRLNGYEVGRRLRHLPGGEQIVMVAVTGYGQEEDRLRSQAAGFDHHLVKPVDPAHLQQILTSECCRPRS
jgi:signal transduction histidine kinase